MGNIKMIIPADWGIPSDEDPSQNSQDKNQASST